MSLVSWRNINYILFTLIFFFFFLLTMFLSHRKSKVVESDVNLPFIVLSELNIKGLLRSRAVTHRRPQCNAKQAPPTSQIVARVIFPLNVDSQDNDASHFASFRHWIWLHWSLT